jgi:hypothetical protein
VTVIDFGTKRCRLGMVVDFVGDLTLVKVIGFVQTVLPEGDKYCGSRCLAAFCTGISSLR